MRKKVLLIYPPVINQVENINISAFDRNIGSYPPLGLLYIAIYLREFSAHEVMVIDAFAEKMNFQQLNARINQIKPDIAGISVMTHFWIDAITIARDIKKILPHTKVVVGGPHATIYPVSTVRNESIDFAVCGEGEITFKKLVEAIAGGESEENISRIPGVASKVHLRQERNNSDIEQQRIEDLNSLPIPDRSLIDKHKYFSVFAGKGTFTTMVTSRGCPFNCIFCDRMGKVFRALSPENVLKEINDCFKQGINSFFMHDDTFTVDRKRVEEICRRIIGAGLDIRWEARARVDCVDYELLKLMQEAGLKRLSFGAESGNEDVLKFLKKGIKLERTKEVFGWCRQLKITTLADFMVGSPGETIKEIDDTLRFAKEIDPDYLQFSITCPYPATPLYEILLKEGRIKSDVWLEFAENPSFDFKPPVASEYFTRGELEDMVRRLYRSFYFRPGFLMQEIKRIRSLEMLLLRVKSGLGLMKS